MEVPTEEYLIPLGLADVKKPGNDVTIVSFGKIMKVALAAAGQIQTYNSALADGAERTEALKSVVDLLIDDTVKDL
jgi:deoxyxylulose-5-phosphate synthase